jgi:hypothetical protein
MKRALSVALVAVALHAGEAWSQDLPQGWRIPTAREITDPVRKDSPAAFAKATADFNGDGAPDEALLLKSTRFSGEALWVRLSKAQGDFEWVKLAEINWGKEYPNVDLAMGIDVLPPGIHPYGCFDGANECNFGPHKDRPKLKLRDPSLMYFKLESAGSLFFWSRKHNKSMRVWLSD